MRNLVHRSGLTPVAWSIVALATMAGACGGGSSSPTAPTTTQATTTPAPAPTPTPTPAPAPTPAPTATMAFHNSPIDPSAIEFIAPLGNLNPPSHTLPTNHIYFYNRLNNPSAPPSVVVAPAAGTVQYVQWNGSDAGLHVQAVTGFTYYMAHVVLDSSIVQGATLTSGERIGMTGTSASAIDLGLVNESLTLGFVNPARYTDEFLHAESPLKYFDEPLRTQLYGLVKRIAADKDGKVAYDVAGRLVGNWFLQGLAPGDSMQPTANAQQLAFVYDSYDGTSIRVSIGGTLGMTGFFGVQGGATDPANVSTASGQVAYRLYEAGSDGQAPGGSSQVGLLIVQMTDDSTIKVQVFAGSGASDANFTSDARTYTR